MYLRFFYLVFMLLFFSACKKNGIGAETDLSHYSHNYYCSHSSQGEIANGAHPISYNRTGDQVVRCYVENGMLYFLDRAFEISNQYQTSFYTEHPVINGIEYAYLDFYNNFDSVKFYFDLSSTTNDSGTRLYTGTKTLLRESKGGHAYEDILAGDYLLNVTKKNYQQQRDTQYTALFPVAVNTGALFLDSIFFFFASCHTHDRYTRSMTWESSTNNIYWWNDSIHIENTIITAPGWGYPLDTVVSCYQGVKQ